MTISMQWTGRLRTWTRRASAPGSNASVAKRSSVSLLAILLMAGCHSPLVIQESRMPVPLDNGNWEVTSGFLQERYQIERGLRGQLERCMAEPAEVTR